MFDRAIESLSIKEKIRAMELLWDDLCRQPETIESPPWHEDILAEREQAIALGTERFTDWESAKQAIRDQLP
jgi:hypothetical protein